MNLRRFGKSVIAGKKLWLRIGIGLLAVSVVVVIGWTWGTRLLADRLEANVRQEWGRTVESIEDFETRFAPRGRNALAARLDLLMARMKLDRKERAGPTELNALADYIFQEGRDPTPRVAPPPLAVRASLARRQERLDEAARMLLESDSPPQWRFALSRMPGGLPLTRHLRLEELLLADALARLHDGCRSEAEERLEAAWRLGVAGESDPELLHRSLAVMVRRRQAIVVRKLGDRRFVWEQRLRPEQMREWTRDAYLREGWWYLRGEGIEWSRFSHSDYARVVEQSGLFEGYRRLCLAGRSNDWRQLTLLEKEIHCGEALESHQARYRELLRTEQNTSSAAWWKYEWDHFPATEYGDFPRFRNWIHQAITELELTRKALEIRRRRGQSKQWPDTIEGIERSICGEHAWVYERSSNGEMRVLFAPGSLAEGDARATAPILEYRAFD